MRTTLLVYNFVTEGSLEVKLPTTWTDGKAEMVRVREEKRRWRRRRSQKRKSEKKDDAGAHKGRKVAKQCVFSVIVIVAPEGRKVGSLKRRCGASWPGER